MYRVYFNVMKKLLFSILAGLSLITGCVSIGTQADRALTLDIQFQEPKRISYRGKGAGAGMALMSSMGSMGVAIGVAIDVGIARDIEEPFIAAGFNIDEMLSNHFIANKNGQFKLASLGAETPDLSILVKKYGFMNMGGENDQTAVELVLEVSKANCETVTINYPDDYKKNTGQSIATQPLKTLKSDGRASKALFEPAIKYIADYAIPDYLAGCR